MDSGSASTTVLVLVIVLIALAIAVPIVIFQQKKQARAWQEIASRLGLALKPRSNALSPVVIEGDYEGRPVVLDTHTVQRNQHSQTWTRIIMTVQNPGAVSMELTKEGALDKVAKRVGAGDIQTGDAELDQRLKITGQPEDEIRGLLTSMALRERLLAQPRLDVRLNQGELRWRTLGVERDSARLRDALDLLSALATGMERG